MTKNTGVRYPDDFKTMIVDRNKLGETRNEFSSEYGLIRATIRSWIKYYKLIQSKN
ncbi:transposase [Clostridium tepidiprofundi DSM 19306]|uniref:Transposase n=1 Tax=Clostridium tepidiprofundi DSM 19306 TaxID=1121338 RepID=A0A151AS25_9CLOT|nr:hypothetical protein [Clostridium tepidiprofundi]KYH30426.1 transposase [Clostridium tepidiprofundi DSM 19306]